MTRTQTNAWSHGTSRTLGTDTGDGRVERYCPRVRAGTWGNTEEKPYFCLEEMEKEIIPSQDL